MSTRTSPAQPSVLSTLAPVRTGSPESDALIERNLPLVGHIVREVLGRVPSHVHRDELVSAGMYGLTTAARAFDAAHNVTFANYAAIRIRGCIVDELRSRDWASRSVRGKARELDDIRTRLVTALGRTPTRQEVASSMGVSVDDIRSIESDVHRASVLSLQAVTSAQGDAPMPIVGEDPESLLLRREQLGCLRDAVEALPERLRQVITSYFFEQRTMVDIAGELGVSESRISQLRSEALRMLRDGMQTLDGELEPEPVREPEPDSARSRRLARADAARAGYVSALSARSSLAARLSASNLLGEPVAALGMDVPAYNVG